MLHVATTLPESQAHKTHFLSILPERVRFIFLRRSWYCSLHPSSIIVMFKCFLIFSVWMIHIYHMHIKIFSPSGLSYEDTYNTLKYADRAMNIKCKVVKNELSVEMHVSRYAKIVEELRLEVNKDITKMLSIGTMYPFLRALKTLWVSSSCLPMAIACLSYS